MTCHNSARAPPDPMVVTHLGIVERDGKLASIGAGQIVAVAIKCKPLNQLSRAHTGVWLVLATNMLPLLLHQPLPLVGLRCFTSWCIICRGVLMH